MNFPSNIYFFHFARIFRSAPRRCAEKCPHRFCAKSVSRTHSGIVTEFTPCVYKNSDFFF